MEQADGRDIGVPHGRTDGGQTWPNGGQCVRRCSIVAVRVLLIHAQVVQLSPQLAAEYQYVVVPVGLLWPTSPSLPPLALSNQFVAQFH